MDTTRRCTLACRLWLILACLSFAIPQLKVPPCSEGEATIDEYFLIQPDGFVPASQQTSTSICWNSVGIAVTTNNTDDDIWQRCTACGCANYANGDVAEMFMAPVMNLADSPAWYYELDVGALAGAFWGGIVNNTLGNQSLYSSSFPCAAVAPAGGFASCPLNCSSTLPSIDVARGRDWWSRSMTVPWEMFLPIFRPSANKTSPWPYWRANFYRYSYPFRAENGSFDRTKPELSAWSPTHSGTFHEPARFGQLHFMQESVSIKV